VSEVRICENCGKKNPVSSLECEACGYDISFCIPVEDVVEESEKNECEQAETDLELWKFTAVDDSSVSFSLKDEYVIGREDCEISDYLNKSDYISRKHCKLYVKDNEPYVIDASTNGTFVNGRKIDKLFEYRLSVGDEITFADVKFKVTR
jgi:hypothetical protein